MPFKTVGKIDVTVTEAFIADPRFPERPGETNNSGNAVGVYADICLLLTAADGQSDFWRGELSNRSGRGNYAGMYQTDITLQTLQDIGFGVTNLQELYAQCVETDAGAQLPNLVGKEATVTTEEKSYTGRDGKERTIIRPTYLNARGAGGPARMSLKNLGARLGLAPATPPAPAPAYQQAVKQTPQQMFSQPGTAAKNPNECPY